MWRKVAIGCGSVFVLLLLAGGGVAWWFIGRPALAFTNAMRDLRTIEATYDDVQDRSDYQPPQDGVLSESQVDRWLDVQAIMQASLADTADQLRDRYDDLDTRLRDPSPGEMADIIRDAADLIVDAAQIHVRALNQNGFSIEEYRWVRNRVLEAAGYSLAGYDLTQIAAVAAIDGQDADAPELANLDVPPPPINVERIAPHIDRVEEALVFAWFGL